MLLKMCSFHEGEVTFPMYLGNAYSFATITGFVVCFGYVSKTFTLKQLLSLTEDKMHKSRTEFQGSFLFLLVEIHLTTAFY